MSIDLYKDDLIKASGDQLYDGIENFVRLGDPPEKRPREGYSLDFKVEWGETALRTVAAFANTFGGLLIVGVSEADGRPHKLVGISSRKSEEKTRIASSIAGNISPTPPFEVADCSLASDSTKFLCVVRVRKGNALHLLTKKGEQPVYVRNQDESRPADAAQLRALIERRYDGNRIEAELPGRLHQLQQGMAVNYSGNLVSQVHLRMSLIPLNRVRLDLDLALEKRFEDLMYGNYPLLLKRLERGAAEDSDVRGRDWYELRWRHKEKDYERRWRITSACDLGFITQVRWPCESGNCWSLYDVVIDTICTIQAARSVWETAGYYEEAQLHADLTVTGLTLFAPDKYPHGFGSLFYGSDDSIDRRCVLLSQQPNEVATADITLDFGSMTSGLARSVASIINQLVRGLKHAADLDKLSSQIEYLVDKMPQQVRGPSYG
jgi:schlafen family protein